MKEENLRKKLMLLPLQKLQKKTDREFQKRRRMEEMIGDGVVRCISCKSFGDYKSYDGGHFIPRHHLGTRYSPENVWPQCKKCNKWLSGNHANYREALIKKIGKESLETLESFKDKDVWKPLSFREFCIEVFIESKIIIKRIENSLI